MAANTKKVTLNLEQDILPWVSFAAGLKDMSQTAYINDALKRDRDSASESVKKAFDLFLKAREG